MNGTYKHLCAEERYMIVNGLSAGHSIRHIARNLNRSASSISRELRRHGFEQDYDALFMPFSGACSSAS